MSMLTEPNESGVLQEAGASQATELSVPASEQEVAFAGGGHVTLSTSDLTAIVTAAVRAALDKQQPGTNTTLTSPHAANPAPMPETTALPAYDALGNESATRYALRRGGIVERTLAQNGYDINGNKMEVR